MVSRNLVEPAALFVEAQPPAFALLDDVLETSDGNCWIGRQDVTHHQVVEQGLDG